MLLTLRSLVETASAGVSLSLSATEGADSASATASLAVSAALAAIEGADTAAAAVAEVVSAALSATEGADLCAATASVGTGAASLALDATEGADTCASSVVPFFLAALAAVEGADLASAGMDIIVPIDLALDATEGADIAASSATVEGGQVVSPYGMGGVYTFRHGSSVPVEDDDHYLDGFLRAEPVVAAGPGQEDVPVHPITTPESPRSALEPTAAQLVVMATVQAEVKAQALKVRHHDHALRLLLLAS